MMQELFVLVEEHASIRTHLDALEEALKHSGAGAERILPPLDELIILLRDFHHPKEEEVLLPRITGKTGLQPTAVLAAMKEERALLEKLCDVSVALRRDGRTASLGVELVPVLHAVRKSMQWEEEVLYPALYSACDEQELWNLSVALDRHIDGHGRQARERIIAPVAEAMREQAAAYM